MASCFARCGDAGEEFDPQPEWAHGAFPLVPRVFNIIVKKAIIGDEVMPTDVPPDIYNSIIVLYYSRILL